MKPGLLLILVSIMLTAVTCAAQDSEPVRQTCTQAIPSKLDEFEYKGLEDAKERLELFGLQIKNTNCYGTVIGYGGRRTRSSEGRYIASEVEQYLTDRFKFYKFVTIMALDGGHRESPTIEVYLTPSLYARPEGSPSLGFEDVSYSEEDSFFPKNVVKRSEAYIRSNLIGEITPAYPPAARAVRARGKVFLLLTVDNSGNVSKVMAVDGHPLLRSAAEEAVRGAKFRKIADNNSSHGYGGKITIDFEKLINNSETN